MVRRVLFPALCLMLVGAVAPAGAATASPCLTFSDKVGDESPAVDPSLDLTSVTFKTSGKSLMAVVKVAKYTNPPLLAPENRFDVLFSVGGKDVVMFWKDSPIREVAANAFFQQGIRVNDVVQTADVSGGWAGNTLTMTIRYKTLGEALAAKVVGTKYTKVSALARAAYGTQATNVTWDSATSRAGASFVGGAACR